MESEGIFLVGKGEPEKAFERRAFEIKNPVANEVLVEVEAFGLNYADVMARKGLYRETPPLPCVIGYEAVGRVINCGPEADRSLLGKRVAAFCRFGGYSKHVITMDYAVTAVNEEPSGELLALCTQGVTAYYMASYLSPVHPTDTVLIHAAAGGVGTFLIQLAKKQGATIIAKVGSEEKAGLVRSLGADHVVNYRMEDYEIAVSKILGDKRLDVSFNPVAGSTYKKDWRMIGSGGRLVLFGASEIGEGKWGILSTLNFVRKMGFMTPIKLMIGSKNILGVNMLRIADNKPEVMKACLSEVIKLYNSGEIKPQNGGEFSIDQLNEAHRLLESGKSTGKISVFW